MDEPICDICADPQKDKFMITLQCGHAFHYECVMQSFISDKKNKYMNKCPLCRQSHGLLPIVNGLNRLIYGIHYNSYNNPPEIINQTKCTEILKTGKRKGECCNMKCMIGMDTCKRHHVSKLKKQEKLSAASVKKVIKNRKKITVNKLDAPQLKLGDQLEQVQLEQALEVSSAVQPVVEKANSI